MPPISTIYGYEETIAQQLIFNSSIRKQLNAALQLRRAISVEAEGKDYLRSMLSSRQLQQLIGRRESPVPFVPGKVFFNVNKFLSESHPSLTPSSPEGDVSSHE